MLAQGFLDEVRGLRARPGLHLDLPSMRCVGYRQAWEALDAADPPDLIELRDRGVAATRQLAKRQVTWLRSMAQRQVVEADAADVEARLLAAVEAIVERAPSDSCMRRREAHARAVARCTAPPRRPRPAQDATRSPLLRGLIGPVRTQLRPASLAASSAWSASWIIVSTLSWPWWTVATPMLTVATTCVCCHW